MKVPSRPRDMVAWCRAQCLDPGRIVDVRGNLDQVGAVVEIDWLNSTGRGVNRGTHEVREALATPGDAPPA